jgi:hypothetical protein
LNEGGCGQHAPKKIIIQQQPLLIIYQSNAKELSRNFENSALIGTSSRAADNISNSISKEKYELFSEQDIIFERVIDLYQFRWKY